MAAKFKSFICLVSVLVPVLGMLGASPALSEETLQNPSPAAARQETKGEPGPLVCESFQASWPEGWSVKPIPYPEQGQGSYSGAMRYRAIKMEDSEPVVIEISVFPRPAGQDKTVCPDADVEQLKKIIDSIKQGYLASGLSASASEPKKTKLASQDAFESVLTVTAPGFQMFQNLLICQTDKNVFSLTYSARDKYFDKSRPAYEAFSRSLVLR